MSKNPTTTPAAAGAAAGEAPAEPAPPPRKKKPLLRYGIIGGVVVALLGGGGFVLAPRLLPGSKPATAAVKREAPIKVTVPLGAVVVNLGRPETRRYLKVAVELGVAGPKESKQVEEHKSQLTDLLITVLTATPIETLAADDGKTALKAALLARMHEELHLDVVKRVYFTEFVIQ
jgi:flagellar basal body-associated protein FliL